MAARRRLHEALSGRRLTRLEYEHALPRLQDALLDAQFTLGQSRRHAVVMIVTGIPAAGRSEVVNELLGWLDPKLATVYGFHAPNDVERERPTLWRYWRLLPLGWCPARMDDIFNFIPARITVLLLLVYFTINGRCSDAVRVMRRDRHKRPGYNGGVVMAAMAGGIGIRFEKPGVYTIGDGERSLDEAGSDIIHACRFVIIAFAVLASGTLILLGSLINSTGI